MNFEISLLDSIALSGDRVAYHVARQVGERQPRHPPPGWTQVAANGGQGGAVTEDSPPALSKSRSAVMVSDPRLPPSRPHRPRLIWFGLGAMAFNPASHSNELRITWNRTRKQNIPAWHCGPFRVPQCENSCMCRSSMFLSFSRWWLNPRDGDGDVKWIEWIHSENFVTRKEVFDIFCHGRK